MRRALLLLALLVLVVWLVSASPEKVKGELRSAWFYSRTAAAAPASVLPNPPCDGCDPNEESACIYYGGSWDPNNCSCTYGCDPNAEAQCYNEGGNWDSYSCSCEYPACNPGSPESTNTVEVEYQYCDGWEIWDCTGTWTDYEQYCEDGSLYNSWTEYTEFCYGTGYYCGDDGCGWDCCEEAYCS